MKSLSILITGGAGFIGSHLVDVLAPRTGKIVILDNLTPQVHGTEPHFSAALRQKAVCIRGDVCDPDILRKIACDHSDINVIIHLAAFTGTGQSMYDVVNYDRINAGGTAVLLQSIVQKQWPALQKVVQASSRAIYGEGAYGDPNNSMGLVYPMARAAADLDRGDWSPHLPGDPRLLEMRPTPEDAPARPTSFYGATKLTQEEYLTALLAALDIPLTMLRFQNVYGPGQSLKNPYTGVIGVFFSKLVQQQQIEVYEDGQVSRDFVYVADVVQALASAVEMTVTGVYNIGSGESTTLLQVTETLQDILQTDLPVVCRGTYRLGDIRHAAADISRARATLSYSPRYSFREGLRQYTEWASQEEPMTEDNIRKANQALATAGFAKSS